MDEPSVIRTPYSKASRRGLPIIGIVVSVEMLLLLLVRSFLMEASDFKCIGGVWSGACK